jgi:putative addiction module killer protein
MAIEIWHYLTASGKDVFESWIQSLEDDRAEARIDARINRLARGNFGDCKPVGGGVWELRIDYGPGYRVYYSMIRRTCVLLLCGGDKRKQASDIATAIEYLKDYKQRSADK